MFAVHRFNRLSIHRILPAGSHTTNHYRSCLKGGNGKGGGHLKDVMLASVINFRSNRVRSIWRQRLQSQFKYFLQQDSKRSNLKMMNCRDVKLPGAVCESVLPFSVGRGFSVTPSDLLCQA